MEPRGKLVPGSGFVFAFAVDLVPASRLTQRVRLLLSTFCLITLFGAGCTTPPVTGFESVPAPSASAPTLPETAVAQPPVIAPATTTKPAKTTRVSKPKPSGPNNSSASALIVTPHPILTGRVTSYNATGRLVVLNFPIGHLPTLEQRMDVFRQGVKVGEVKITGPQRDDHIVADVTTGEAQAGDEVRER